MTDEVRRYPGLSDTDPELVTTLKKIRYDLTDLQVKVSEALRQAAALNLPAPVTHECPTCRSTFRGERSLGEHVYYSHDGPLPEHLLSPEERRGEERSAA